MTLSSARGLLPRRAFGASEDERESAGALEPEDASVALPGGGAGADDRAHCEGGRYSRRREPRRKDWSVGRASGLARSRRTAHSGPEPRHRAPARAPLRSEGASRRSGRGGWGVRVRGVWASRDASGRGGRSAGVGKARGAASVCWRLGGGGGPMSGPVGRSLPPSLLLSTSAFRSDFGL